jgi:hypothetical protein
MLGGKHRDCSLLKLGIITSQSNQLGQLARSKKFKDAYQQNTTSAKTISLPIHNASYSKAAQEKYKLTRLIALFNNQFSRGKISIQIMLLGPVN